MRIRRSYASLVTGIFLLALLGACGGGGSSSPAPVATTTISGTVFAAPVGGAKVSAKNASGYAIAGPVTTSSNGAFSIDIPTASLSGDLTIEAEEGTYVDEATGETTPAGRLAAFAPQGSLHAGSSVNLDPSSTIVCDLVAEQGKTLADANTIFTSAFGYTPDTSVSPINAPSPGTDKSQSLAGLRAIAFSQLTRNLGLGAGQQSALIAALAQDLSDGVLDGKNGTSPVTIVAGKELPEDIQNKCEEALVGLLSDASVNQTGLTPDQIGAVPFSKTALTAGYKVEYIPGAMAATQGKTMFRIRLTDRATGGPATGKAVGLMPKMHMATMSHSAPVDTVVDNNDGTYSCTVYYLMASGPGMGVWELKVTIGGMSGESATFYPSVGMSMGTTSKANLKGVADLIPAMGGAGTTSRTYPLFYDGMSGGMGGTSTFRLFIAASDDMMLMKWPAVSPGTMLHDQSGAVWTVNSMTVEASTDKSMWLPGTDDGNGHWSVPGLTGLSSGGAVYVRVVVNGEQKTTDGKAASGDNGYQTFTVASGM